MKKLSGWARVAHLGVALSLATASLPGKSAELNAPPRDVRADTESPEVDPFNCGDDHEAPTPLSLAGAVDLALCNNSSVREAWANIRVQEAGVGEARSAYWPTVTASVSKLRDETAFLDSPQPTDTRTGNVVYGSLTWRLFDFGGRAAGLRAADSLLRAAVATRDATVQKTLGTVVQAYFDAITAESVNEDRNEDDALAKETLASAERRAAQGGASHSDVLQAATAAAHTTLEQSRAIVGYQKAFAVLRYLMGVQPDVPVHLAD
jgi:outer membrane protein